MKEALTVERNMSKYPILGVPEMTVHQAMRLMKTFHIRHLPVVKNEAMIGVVSQRDLLGVPEAKAIGEIMAKSPYVVRPETPLSEVTCNMASEKFGSTVVVNSVGEVLGIFTTTDALKMLTWYLTKEERESKPARERLIEEWFEWDASMGE